MHFTHPPSYVVSALTANATPGCRWPKRTALTVDRFRPGNGWPGPGGLSNHADTAAPSGDGGDGGSDWHVLPGVEIEVAALAVAVSPGAGERLCELRDDCYALQTFLNGTTQLHGTGAARAGGGGSRALRFTNVTLRTGVAPAVYGNLHITHPPTYPPTHLPTYPPTSMSTQTGGGVVAPADTAPVSP